MRVPHPIADRVRAASDHASDRWLVAWALGYAAVGAASLLVPLYALALGGGPFIVAIVEATAALAGVPGAILWGRLADRTGRRRTFVMISLAGSAVALAAFPVVASLTHVLVINAILWFLIAAASPVVTLFVLDHRPERDWEARIGLLNAYQRYGWVGGLLVGTVWLAVVSTRSTPLVAQRSFFVACAAAALLAVPLSFYWLPPRAATTQARLTRSAAFTRLVTGAGRYVKLIPYAPARAISSLTRPGRAGALGRMPAPLRRYLIVVFVFSAGFAVFFGPAPAYLDALGYASAWIFAFFIVSSLASAVLFVPIGRLAGRHSPKTLQAGALSVRVAVFPAIGLLGLAAIVARTGGLGVAFAVIGATWAIVVVTAAGIVTRIAPAGIRGEVLGLYTALSGVGGGVGGLLGGGLARVAGYNAAFVVAGVIVLVSLVALLALTLPIERSSTVDS